MVDIDFKEIPTAAYEALNACRQDAGKNSDRLEDAGEQVRDRLKAQKNQATELYNYLATWGLLRLMAEELAIDNGQAQKKAAKQGRKEVMKKFFEKLEEISGQRQDLKTVSGLSGDQYLALSGLALMLSKEFGFWANAVYHDIQGGSE